MKESKGVYVNKHNIREDLLNRNYQLYTSRVTRQYAYEVCTREVGVQYNYKRDNVICTCRNVSGLRRHQEIRYFSGLPKQVYAYHGSRSYTDIGVGSVKAFQRRKVKRIYLPETDDRGVGSSDLSSFISRRCRNYRGSYYDQKKTSSKCVGGGVIEFNAEFINEKLSPIVHTRSVTTSPSIPYIQEPKNNVDIGNNTLEETLAATSTQVQNDSQKEDPPKDIRVIQVTVEQVKEIPNIVTKKSKEVVASIHGKRVSKRAQEAERVFSSDSLVQHVHNLEHPSQDKPSPMSIDPMENKLEREYRKMFSTKSKDSKDQKSSKETTESMKSASVLRRRFEALRRGLAKKDDPKKNAILAAKESSNVSALSHKDVSIASDPPSLEARSFSTTKVYNPDKRHPRIEFKKSSVRKEWSRVEEEDSECQGVKGMFKLWGKRFNLDDDESPGPSGYVSKRSKDSKIPATDSDVKKEGKKFFFFKKKSKDKTKQPYKPKKGVTAGRCEVGDGLMIKIGAASNPPIEEKQQNKERKVAEKVPKVNEDILRKAWLQQFLAQTIESRNSVKIRWNNSAYATSSSTIFEIMENVYKDTGVVFRSKSEVTTGDSSYYKSSTKQRVNFVQDIEAWMIPKLIPDRIKPMPVIIRSDERGDKKDNIEVTISDHKWFIDKSKAFAHKIEVVLHSKNIVTSRKQSSEYLRIDIPKGFFSDTTSTDSTGPIQTSNEEVYKIVEYETLESNSVLRRNKNFGIGDHVAKDIKVTVSVKDSGDAESKVVETVIKTPPLHRDVVIQGSNVYIPKRCNVIGVGIITQKDVTRVRKPILKIQDDTYSDEDSDQTVNHYHRNKSTFAESYLQDYYRNWTPLGIDFFSWCVSDSHVKCCSENSRSSVNQQGDGTKSCPNIYDDYHASTMISSCGTSCCSKCAPYENPKSKEKEGKKGSKFFSKFKRKKSNNAAVDQTDIRVLPKDSLEVFKRRKYVNESSNKSKWSDCPDDGPYSIPSIESIGAQDTLGDCSTNNKKAGCKPAARKRKVCNKHVSMYGPGLNLPPEPDPLADPGPKCPPQGILTFKGSAKCDYCNKGKSDCPKHAKTIPEPICEIPAPTMPCKEPIPVNTLITPEISPRPSSPKLNDASGFPDIYQTSPQYHSNHSPINDPAPPTSLSNKSSAVQIVAHCCSSQVSMQSKENNRSRSKPPCQSLTPKCVPFLTPSPHCPPKTSPKRRSPPPTPRKREAHLQPCPTSPPCLSPPRSPLGAHLRSPPHPRSPPRAYPCPTRPTSPPCPPRPQSPPCPPRTPSPPCPPRPRSPPCPPRPQSPPCPTYSPPPCPPQKLKPKPKSPTKMKKCDTPPCSPPKPAIPPCTACKKCPSQEFPWPMRNQVSNQPSLQFPNAEPASQLVSNESKCKKNCSFLPERPKEKPCPKKCYSPPKVSGIFLKKQPSKKTCAKDCSAWSVTPPDRSVDRNRRCRSDDDLIINIKQSTPSTEEIREGMHIKVQDEDGKTLYERIDYRRDGRPSVLKDMYKTDVHTVSTSIVQNMAVQDENSQSELQETKSEVSVANLIEINFKLKVTQGDKTTEINIGKDGEANKPKADTKNQIEQTSQQVFCLKDEAEQCAEEVNDKNDINIKIIIKNYKPKTKGENMKSRVEVENFSQKISEKLNTVSTGYSDVFQSHHSSCIRRVEETDNTGSHENFGTAEKLEDVPKGEEVKNDNKELTSNADINVIDDCKENMKSEENAKRIFSVHRATVNLASSNEISKTQAAGSTEAASVDEFVDRPVDVIMTSRSVTDKSGTEQSESKLEDKSKNYSDIEDSQNEHKGTGGTEYSITDNEDQDQALELNNTSDEPVNEGVSTDLIPESLTKEEKKRLLMKLFEKAYKGNKTKSKDGKKQLRDMLKVILTSDSSNNNVEMTSNELVEEMTYPSLKPNYFRNNDSLNNYYNSSAMSSTKEINQNLRYPTQNASQSSVQEDSDASTSNDDYQEQNTCMCSTFAAKLNMCKPEGGGACCCRKAVTKIDGETCCDIRTEEDFLLLNYNTIEYIDVETQNSRFICDSANISIHSKGFSGSIRNSIEITPRVTEIVEKTGKLTDATVNRLSHDENKVAKVKRNFSPHKNHIRPCQMRKLNRNTVLGISDEDKVYLLDAKPTKETMQGPSKDAKRNRSKDKMKSRKNKRKYFKAADILQCYDTKKAVLEIYAEKMVSEKEERFVAKLPKFAYEKESDIERNYEQYVESYRSLKRNFVMSVKR